MSREPSSHHITTQHIPQRSAAQRSAQRVTLTLRLFQRPPSDRRPDRSPKSGHTLRTCSAVQCSTAQHSTAQVSTAHLSTAQLITTTTTQQQHNTRRGRGRGRGRRRTVLICGLHGQRQRAFAFLRIRELDRWELGVRLHLPTTTPTATAWFGLVWVACSAAHTADDGGLH